MMLRREKYISTVFCQLRFGYPTIVCIYPVQLQIVEKFLTIWGNELPETYRYRIQTDKADYESFRRGIGKIIVPMK